MYIYINVYRYKCMIDISIYKYIYINRILYYRKYILHFKDKNATFIPFIYDIHM